MYSSSDLLYDEARDFLYQLMYSKLSVFEFEIGLLLVSLESVLHISNIKTIRL